MLQMTETLLRDHNICEVPRSEPDWRFRSG